MKKIFLAVFISLIGLSCTKKDSPKMYSMYKCQDGAVPACDDTCIKQPVKISYLINKEEKSVMGKSYIDGKNTYSHVRKNCIIFDENNWDCSTEEKTPPFITVKDMMSDGVHKFYIQTINMNTKNLNIVNASCTKLEK